MFNDIPALTSLRAFEAAVRLGAFNLAAEELNVTPAAVGAQVRLLEASLGLELFERKNRRVIPTAFALRLQQACQSGFSAILKVIESHASDKNSLTVGVGSLFASCWLSPRLSEFWLAHPEISLRLAHSPVIKNALPEDLDVAIVWGKGNWPNVLAQCVLHPALLPVAAPEYLAKHGRPKSPTDLLSHSLIQEQDISLWNAWFEQKGQIIDSNMIGISAKDGAVAMQLALDGQGIHIGVKDFIEDDLKQGRLVELFEPIKLNEFAYYLVYRKTSDISETEKHFIAWLMQNKDTPTNTSG